MEPPQDEDAAARRFANDINSRVQRRLIERGQAAEKPRSFTCWPPWMPHLISAYRESERKRAEGEPAGRRPIRGPLEVRVPAQYATEIQALDPSELNKRFWAGQRYRRHTIITTSVLYNPSHLFSPVHIEMSLSLLDRVQRSVLNETVFYSAEDPSITPGLRREFRGFLDEIRPIEVERLVLLAARARAGVPPESLTTPPWLANLRNSQPGIALRNVKQRMDVARYRDIALAREMDSSR